ncbi:MAG: hypothetical protein ACFFDW_09775 [Candidatus Thorarchaeota archaeon]
MNLIKIQKIVFISTFISNILFLLLTTIAMLVYSGGTQFDPSIEHYLFFENFFSDLGRSIAFSGESNIVCQILFISALSIEGLSLLFYFIVIVPIFKEKKNIHILSILGSISGIICALGYIFIGIFPLDFNDVVHGTFSFIAFIATFFALVFYAIVILLDKSYPKYYGWIFIACSILSLGYIIIFFGGGTQTVLSNLTLQAISQKIIVYVQIITLAIQAIGSYFYLKKRHTLELTIN